MQIKDMQGRVMANKIKRGFNTTNTGPEIIHLTEELGELAEAYRNGDHVEMVDAAADLIVYGIGLMSILGCDAEEELRKVLLNNEDREYRDTGVHSLE